MKIDFVLPLKIDDEGRMNLALQTLVTFFQTVNAKYFNRLIVVDDVSTFEGFRDELNRQEFLTNNLIISQLNKVPLGVGGSKNKGIQLAQQYGRGDLIYIMDCDVYYTDNWLEDLLEAYSKYGSLFKIIGAGIHPYLQPRINEDTDLLTSHDAVSGWSWLLSYDTWDKYGKLMDNSLGVGKSEDWEYCQRIRNSGFRVGCLKNQKVAHCGLINSEGNQIPGYEESKILAKSVAPEALLLL